MAEDADVLQQVLGGQTGGGQTGGGQTDGGQMGGGQGSNMIRVFISSTFTDMSSERKVLLERAAPELLTFCRSQGLVLEVVDLRWGIRNDSSGDHESCEVSLQEIQRSHRISAGPCFTALLGNRYGQRALPRLIPEKHFETLLSKMSKNPEGVKLLSQWFLKDDNAVPPTYVLQPITAHFPHYCDLRPESGPQRDGAAVSWRSAESKLLQLLRSAATAAEAAGDISVEERQRFFTSVTEQEFLQVLWKDDSDSWALLFVRELPPRQRAREGPKRFAKLLDLKADALLDAQAQELLAGLKSRLLASSKNILNLHSVELSKGGVDAKRKEHAHYLESLSQQFVEQMSARIAAAVDGRKSRRRWGGVEEEESQTAADQVLEEVRRHATLSHELSRGLVGREGILGKLCLTMWESTDGRHGPLVVHGRAGMGKTALLCKLAQEMQRVLEAGSVVAVRLLASRHPRRPDIDQVLYGICLQVCLACGLAPPSPLTAGSFPDLLRFFRSLLDQVSQQGSSAFLVLDAVDQLSERHHAHSLYWLPARLPPNIHLVVSMETSSEALANARLKVERAESFLEVERLSRDEGKQMVESNLRVQHRTLTPEQSAAVLRCLDSSGCPAHLRLVVSAAKRWSSFTPLSETQLGASAQEMMSQLFLLLEKKHGKELVGGALGYIALAREGLLEAELRDLLSLDDDVIKEVYRYSLPPTRSLIRLPPLLWARLRRDLEDQLEERWTDGVVAIAFNSRRVSEAVSSRYLASERRGRSHRVLAEYFQGRWAGKLKPASLPGLSLLLSDRKVPPQPLWFAPGLANVRKLQEMPYHLLYAGLWEELRQEVVSCADWLVCKSRVCGVSSVIQDLDRSARYMDCMETGLIRDALVLVKPSVDFLDGRVDVSLFFTELLARLCSLAPSFPLIGRLCGGCEEGLLTCAEPVMIPKCSFLQQPGGALQRTLQGLQGGILCLDVGLEAELLAAGSDRGEVALWSLGQQELVHTLLGHSGAVLSVKVVYNLSCCLSLAADGCLRGWSLKNGLELLCIQGAGPAVDSATSSVRLHLYEQTRMLCVYTGTQVTLWSLEGAELHSSSAQEGCAFVGLVDDCVFSVSDSGRIRIVDRTERSQAVEAQLENPLTPLRTAAAPRRGKVFVAAAEGSLLQISKSGKHSVVKFPPAPSLLSVTVDEKILIAAADDTVSLFNLDRDPVEKILDLDHDEVVLCACVSSSGRLLASGAADQLVRIWSVTTGALVDSLCGSDAPVTSVSFSKEFVISASASDSCVRVWSLKYDTRHKPPAHAPTGSAHLPPGPAHLPTGSAPVPSGFAPAPTGAAPVPSGPAPVPSGHAHVPSGPAHLPTGSAHIPSDSAPPVVTRDAQQVFFVHPSCQNEVVSWNTDRGCLTQRFGVSAEVRCLELAQQRRLLLVGLTSGTVLIYPLALPLETLCIPPPESLSAVRCVSMSAAERHLAVAYDDALCLFKMALRDGFPTVEGPLQRAPLQAPPSCMALLNDRRLLYGTGCGAVRLHDFSGGAGADLEPHPSRVTCVSASNWGTHALVGSQDATHRLWALNPLTLDHTIEYKGFFFEGVLCAAFSESDQVVFTGSQDRTVKVWDVSSGNLLYVQYTYAPVVRMVTQRNGFVALTREGVVIREVFRCPEHLSPDYNPLRNVQAQYRVTSRDKNRDALPGAADFQDFNPAGFNLSLMSMMGSKSSAACLIL